MPVNLDDLDRKILNIIQSEFPLEGSPYRTIANKLKVEEKDIYSRVQELREKGIIRRIGAVFEPTSFGYVSTLCAVKAREDNLDSIVGKIIKFQEVTHCYEREDDFNIWFTLTAENINKAKEILTEIETLVGRDNLMEFPAIKTYKIKVDFKL